MFQRTRRRHPRLEIIPLVDVMFFLVTFFLIFSTFKMEPLGIEVELPRASSGRESLATTFVVTVVPGGGFYANGAPLSEAALRRELARALQVRPELLVIVRADRSASVEELVRAVDISREAGAYRIALAVQRLDV